jgi:hypothetical protein
VFAQALTLDPAGPFLGFGSADGGVHFEMGQ